MIQSENFFVYDKQNYQTFSNLDDAKLYAEICIESYRKDIINYDDWDEDVFNIFIGEISHKVNMYKMYETNITNEKKEEDEYYELEMIDSKDKLVINPYDICLEENCEFNDDKKCEGKLPDRSTTFICDYKKLK